MAVILAHSTSLPAYPPSAHTRLIVGNALRTASSVGRAPSRSWTLAAVTSTITSRPIVSTTMWRLRPLTFLPAS